MRALLIGIGVAMAGYGVVLLWDDPLEVIVRIALWAAAGVVLHDFVFAPIAAAFGLAGRRLIKGRWWAPVTVAGLCTATLILLAVPVYTRPGAHADNPTVLDRDYPLGFWIAIAVVWACVPLYYAIDRVRARRLLPVRQEEVVEQQGADDVERQPPSV
jgi:hypothetical protein